MKNPYFLLLLISQFLALHAMAGMGKIRAKILRPATVAFPARIEKIVLAERSCGNCMRSATGQRIYDAPDTTQYSQLGYFRTTLQLMNRYEIMMGAIDTAFLAQEKYQVMPPLNWDEVGRLTNYDSTAVLIVLEEVDAASIGDFQYEHRVWRIYDYTSRTILDEFDHKYEFQRVYRAERRTTYMYSQALTIYANRIMPHWEEVIREYYHKGNNRLKAAAVCLQTLNWEGASANWRSAAADSAKNRMLSAKACYNMAVYYELTGNLDSAQVWIARAVRWRVPLAEEYAAVIRLRQAEVIVVRQQLANRQGQMPVQKPVYHVNRAWTTQKTPPLSTPEHKRPGTDAYWRKKNQGVATDPR
jgi:hypothetical protein